MSSREEKLARLRSSAREIALGQKFEVEDFDLLDAKGIAALFYAALAIRSPILACMSFTPKMSAAT